MRQITKDIQITIDGTPLGFRLTKLDAFSGVTLLRLLMRLENLRECHPEQAPAQSKPEAAPADTARNLPEHRRIPVPARGCLDVAAA